MVGSRRLRYYRRPVAAAQAAPTWPAPCSRPCHSKRGDVVEAMCEASGREVKAAAPADGGASGNDLLMQLQADQLQVPVQRPPRAGDHRPRRRLPGGTGRGRLVVARRAGHPLGPRRRVHPPATSQAGADARHAGWSRAVQRSRGWSPAGLTPTGSLESADEPERAALVVVHQPTPKLHPQLAPVAAGDRGTQHHRVALTGNDPAERPARRLLDVAARVDLLPELVGEIRRGPVESPARTSFTSMKRPSTVATVMARGRS